MHVGRQKFGMCCEDFAGVSIWNCENANSKNVQTQGCSDKGSSRLLSFKFGLHMFVISVVVVLDDRTSVDVTPKH